MCRDASISVVARLQVVSDKVQNATAPTELRATASDSIAVRRPASPSLPITLLRCSLRPRYSRAASRSRSIVGIRRAADHICAEPIVQTIPLWEPWRCSGVIKIGKCCIPRRSCAETPRSASSLGCRSSATKCRRLRLRPSFVRQRRTASQCAVPPLRRSLSLPFVRYSPAASRSRSIVWHSPCGRSYLR